RKLPARISSEATAEDQFVGLEKQAAAWPHLLGLKLRNSSFFAKGLQGTLNRADSSTHNWTEQLASPGQAGDTDTVTIGLKCRTAKNATLVAARKNATTAKAMDHPGPGPPEKPRGIAN